MYRERNEALRALARAHHEALLRLSIAAEFRDDDTGTHIVRMGFLAEALALALGQSPPWARLLRMAAPMHDVGKIGVPDNVLKKPGPLTPEERAVMNRHAAMGAEIPAPRMCPLFRLASEVALSHHERWDGAATRARAGWHRHPAVGPHRRRGRLLRCPDDGPLLPARHRRRHRAGHARARARPPVRPRRGGMPSSPAPTRWCGARAHQPTPPAVLGVDRRRNAVPVARLSEAAGARHDRIPPPAAARAWLRRLRHQLLVLLAGVMLVAMGALYALSSQRAADAGLQASTQWAGGLARAAASATAPLLVRSDQEGMEKALRDIARPPGVLRIDVRDHAGVAAVAARARRRQRGCAPPAGRHGAGAQRRLGARAAGSGRRHRGPAGLAAGRSHHAARPVGVLFSQDGEREQLLRLQRELFLAIALGGALTIGGVYAFMLRSLAPLQRVVRFSRDLGQNIGRTLHEKSGSREVAELTEALNHASRTLQQQLVAMRDGEARVHSLLDATPDAILALDGQRASP